MIPYGRQSVDEDDIRAVAEVLRGDWLTTGPTVEKFEAAVASFAEKDHGVAVSSGTASLHATMFALGVGPGDEVIVPTMTFAATANAVVYQGAMPVFADVEADTLLIDVADTERRITDRTKAIVAVDYAGQPCDYSELRALCDDHDLALVSDACHSIGATYHERPAVALPDLSVFSFHPVKHITTGEGGMVVSDRDDLARRVRRFRNHGIDSDHRVRAEQGTWFYEMVDLGYNYRITDFQCALGLSQLAKLPTWIARRRAIAERYMAAFETVPGVNPLTVRPDRTHSSHLYVVRIPEGGKRNRDALYRDLREGGIGVNVHYVPVHLHPYYQANFGTRPGDYPVAESAYREILSLPMFPTLSESEVNQVIQSLKTAVAL